MSIGMAIACWRLIPGPGRIITILLSSIGIGMVTYRCSILATLGSDPMDRQPDRQTRCLRQQIPHKHPNGCSANSFCRPVLVENINGIKASLEGT